MGQAQHLLLGRSLEASPPSCRRHRLGVKLGDFFFRADISQSPIPSNNSPSSVLSPSHPSSSAPTFEHHYSAFLPAIPREVSLCPSPILPRPRCPPRWFTFRYRRNPCLDEGPIRTFASHSSHIGSILLRTRRYWFSFFRFPFPIVLRTLFSNLSSHLFSFLAAQDLFLPRSLPTDTTSSRNHPPQPRIYVSREFT